MKTTLGVGILFCAVTVAVGQDSKKEFAGKQQPGAVLERFYLNGGKTHEGIWDAAHSQIHLVNKTNHIGNLPVATAEIQKRQTIGDGSKVKLYSDLDMAEKVVLLHQQNVKAAQNRLSTANQNRVTLHQTYKGKNLPKATYNAVMAQYKAADDEVANSQRALETAHIYFSKSLETYHKLGGKTDYKLP